MYTVEFPMIRAKYGEQVQMVLPVTDRNGEVIPEEDYAGATAEFKVARRVQDAAVLTKTEADDIEIDAVNSKLVIDFNTDEITPTEIQSHIVFFAQVSLTIDGVKLWVAEGNIRIDPVID